MLPIERADMCYKCIEEDPYDIVCKPYSEWKEKYKGVLVRGDANVIPCWSFAALFGVMPQINEWNIPHGHKNDKLSQFEPKICKIWEHSIIPSYKVTYDNGLSTDIYDNPVDAAFEMVLKLHELGLL